jgi:hypothetical protein
MVLALTGLAACESEPEEAQSKKEHVWKEQSQAIDKAREVETILQHKKNEEKQ